MQHALGIRRLSGRWTVAALTGLAIGAYALLSLAAGPAHAAKAKALAPIIIGDTCDCTGQISSVGAGWYPGVKVWAEWTNAHGGILGHKVQIDEKDDQSSPVTTETITNQLLATKGIVAVIPGATQTTDTTTAPAPFTGSTVDAAGVPLVGGGDDGLPWFTDPDFFETGTIPTALASFLGAMGAAHASNKNAADFYLASQPSASASIPLFKAGVTAAGGSLVAVEALGATASTYAPACLAAQSAGAGYVWPSMAGTQVTQVADNCAAQGYKPLYVVPDFASNLLTDANMNGAWYDFTDAIYNDTSLPAVKVFYEAIKKYDPSLLKSPLFGEYAIQAWTSAEGIEKAIELAKPKGAITAATVKKGLYLFHGQTLGGLAPPLTFTPGKPSSADCVFEAHQAKGKLVDISKPFCPSSS